MRILTFFLLISSVHFSFSQNYSYSAIPEELLKNANAIVRLDEMDISLHAVNKMTYKGKIVTTVLNKKGGRKAFNSLYYDKQKKIKDVEVIVYDKTGREINKYSKRKFMDASAVDGFSLYLDDRVLYHRYIPVEYPYTISFTYEMETSDTGVIPPWYFLSSYGESVSKSRYRISYSSEKLKPIIKEFNLEDFDYEKNESSNFIEYKADNISALKSEILSPSLSKITPRLMSRIKNFHFKGQDASVDNWKEFGTWVNDKLLYGRDQLEPSTVQTVKKLVAEEEDSLEKAKIIYKYVQDNTRYVSVQIGIGGFQPISAIEVDRVKYGDCKGLSNYTKALLKAVGVQSYYAVVEAGRDKVDFEDDFADLTQGNHAILAIPYKGTYYWIDCTSQILPFGYIGRFTDDRKVMIVKPEGGEIVTTTPYLDAENHQKTTSIVRLNKDGGIHADAKIITKGSQYYSHFRLEQEPEDKVLEHYKEYWSYINNLKVEQYQFKNDKDSIVFSENVSIQANNYASPSGKRVLLPINVLNRSGFIPQRYRNRKLPFEIQRGYLDEDETVIEIPDDYEVEAIPESTSIENKFGFYTTEIVINDKKINYRRKLLVKHGEYSKTDYDAYRKFQKEVTRNDNSKIVLIKP
ncbi:DUF3857 domain-containing protein [Flagellimonas pacifica]|uniref:Transglutaminase-like enzyme, putative cysteine protease n=1 Tax=Flagellimonas pacifica TaxID=1247520 RepID=A0A285MYI9_9FLAO|nr:DUF3857 domain-containing protein [Allomuricauda parva]SNZ00856.1 Transglutaminase-like enzyme, putative cysteine protease [Allomuricauda parva]